MLFLMCFWSVTSFFLVPWPFDSEFIPLIKQHEALHHIDTFLEHEDNEYDDIPFPDHTPYATSDAAPDIAMMITKKAENESARRGRVRGCGLGVALTQLAGSDSKYQSGGMTNSGGKLKRTLS